MRLLNGCAAHRHVTHATRPATSNPFAPDACPCSQVLHLETCTSNSGWLEAPNSSHYQNAVRQIHHLRKFQVLRESK